MGQSDLDNLNDRCRVLSSEINGLVENRMRTGQDPMDDKLSIFRQQVRNLRDVDDFSNLTSTSEF